MRKYIVWVVLTAGLLFPACNRKKPSLPPPDKSEVKEIHKQLNIKIKRYEQALFNLPKDSLEIGLKNLQTDYHFLKEDLKDSNYVKEIRNFLNVKNNRQLYLDVQKKYPDLSEIEREFNDAFSLLKYYFPDAEIPHIYTAVSGLYYEMPVMFYDSTLMIALDMFLGKDYKLYKRLGQEVPQFIRRRFSPEYILPSCFGELSYKYIKAKPLQSNLLDAMILEGKCLLFTEMMLPNFPDSLIFPFPQEKIEWAKSNEANIWGFLIQGNYLYSKDKMAMRKLVGEAPFTNYFGNDSPGRIGAWVGWRICRSWVEKNPKRNIGELFSETDAQKILTESKYKPQK
ncbi:MAG: hypothetical protein FWH36_02535 [Lentimicrobiaceae bacterium]|nr:hypothetical protein [Lentimicrobiaceae bacterium]